MSSSQLQNLQQAVKRDPRDPALRYELGGLQLQDRPDLALETFKTALKLAPGHPQVLLQLGNALFALGRFEEAAAQFAASLQADSAQPGAHYNLGNALRESGKPQQAAESYRAALRLDANDADCHNNLGNVLREMGRLDEAIVCYQTALRLNPRLHHARMHLLHQRQHICDWRDWEAQIAEIRRLVRDEPQAAIAPFAFLSLPGATAAEQRLCSVHWVKNRFKSLTPPPERLAALRSRPANARLRVGYLSADFREHPLATLALELVELHDRQGFEIFGYSCGADDKTSTRKRWESAFDRFRDIRPLSLQQTAQAIFDDRVDILVDLTGYTHDSRSGLLALRPAPIQVNWLGFPGTLGAPFADYLLTDRIITPASAAADYSEQLAFLPECYQPNNRTRPDAPTPTRVSCGLPAEGTVFCCFNQNFKITPQAFDSWMKILSKTPQSVLWLLECNVWAKDNLRREAELRGIHPDRLIFAPRVAQAEHIARHRCADLFLDTAPYNAHTSASDALWAGLPLLTLPGETFASRVAASLLQAAGLPELVAHSREEYENTAIDLAANPARLNALRERLIAGRAAAPLFDTPRFTRNLEALYRAMWSRHAQGLPPSSLILENPNDETHANHTH
ncbi:MAG: tetratricopeptide repeat protein [Methylobacillus sp.]|jgi:predicted O-linked N-acetylglucosamine transferase (SPINDLY family)|nr:tetratricopeptide repeat protein [Methylobacillus sp.]